MHKDHHSPVTAGEAKDVIVAIETAPELVEVKLGPGEHVAVVIARAARDAGLGENVFVFVDDADEPLDVTIALDDGYPHHRRHHVHRHRQVEVTVHYDRGSRTRVFSPAARIERVLLWAIEAFGIEAGMASEFELTRDGEGVAGSEHLGRFADHPHGKAEFDLGRGPITNGAPR